MTALWRRVLAIAAGFVTVAVLSLATDVVLRGVGVFPPLPKVMSDGLFALAASYRAAFTVLGGAVTTVLAREASYRPAQILAGLGLLGGLAGVAAWFATPDIGPLWYALSIPVSAIPCTLLGAWLARRANSIDPGGKTASN